MIIAQVISFTSYLYVYLSYKCSLKCMLIYTIGKQKHDGFNLFQIIIDS